MAVHRTRQQKIEAQLRRQQQYSLDDIQSPAVSKSKNYSLKNTSPKSEALLPYSMKFIRADLLRSIVATVVVVAMLFVVWWMGK